MEWINIKDKLPTIPISDKSWEQYIKVICVWGNNWAEMRYVRKDIRGKIIERFEWQDKINTFPIEFWAIPDLPNK